MKISGYYNITPKLTDYDKFYLLNFNLTPHLKRNVDLLDKIYNGKNGYKGYYGIEGELFINYKVDFNGHPLNNPGLNKINKKVVIDNKPPSEQPNIICPWKPTLDGKNLISGNYKVYHNNYGWLKWLIKNFFIKNNYELNGEVNIINNNKKNTIKIEKNEISCKIKDYHDKTDSNKKSGKSNNEIVEDLIDKTKNKEIIWNNDDIKYYTFISIKDRIDILIHLYIKNQSILNIYIRKGNSKKLVKSIKNLKVNELINYVEK